MTMDQDGTFWLMLISGKLGRLHNVVAKIHEWLSRAVIEGRAALTALVTGSNAEDLAAKLRGVADECSQGTGMEIKFETTETPIELSSDVAEQIFRIGYETIRNAFAHSQGSILDLQLIYVKGLETKSQEQWHRIRPEWCLGLRFRSLRLRWHERAGPASGRVA